VDRGCREQTGRGDLVGRDSGFTIDLELFYAVEGGERAVRALL
jgi:hypothetical protein